MFFGEDKKDENDNDDQALIAIIHRHIDTSIQVFTEADWATPFETLQYRSPNTEDEDDIGYWTDTIEDCSDEENYPIYEDQAHVAEGCVLLANNTYDIINNNTWIGDTGASSHMTNNDEGMFDTTIVQKQFINVGNGERLQVVKRGKKRCIIKQKSGKEIHIILDKVNYVPGLSYNLFSIVQTLKKGWSITNDGMNIKLTYGNHQIAFDRIFKCPTGQNKHLATMHRLYEREIKA
jgi:hypothetical protein